MQDSHGNIVDYDRILEEIYSELEILDSAGWGVDYSHRCVVADFYYDGPLPTDVELLLRGAYLIKAGIGWAESGANIYCVKPFTELTTDEKSIAILVDGFQTSISVPLGNWG